MPPIKASCKNSKGYKAQASKRGVWRSGLRLTRRRVKRVQRRRYRLSRARQQEPFRTHLSQRWATRYCYVVLLARTKDETEFTEMVTIMRSLTGDDCKVLYGMRKRRRWQRKGVRWPEKVLLANDAALFYLRLSFPKLIWKIKRIACPLAVADAETPPSDLAAEPALAP